jgi:hypothetical protein
MISIYLCTESYQLPVIDRYGGYTRRYKSFIVKILHNIDEYSNTNRIVVTNIRILIFGIRFSSTGVTLTENEIQVIQLICQNFIQRALEEQKQHSLVLRLLTRYNCNSGWYTIVLRIKDLIVRHEVDVIIIQRIDWLTILCFTSHVRIFSLIWRRQINGEDLHNLGLCSGSFSRKWSLSCHTCCDMGTRFSSLIKMTVPLSRLLRHTRGCWGSILTWILTGLIQQMVKTA